MPTDLSQRMMAAINAHQSGQLDVARTAYRSLLSDFPNQPDALHYLGMIYYQEEDFDRALDCVDRARNVKPTDPAISANLGLVYQALGRMEDAEAMYKASLDVNPEQAEAWFNRGLTRLSLHRYPEACFCFHKSLTIDPQHLQAQRQLGVALLSMGKGKEASEALQRCIAAAPDDTELRIELGRALEAAGDMKAAEAEYRRAAVGGGEPEAKALARLSVVLRRLESLEAALEAAKSSLSIRPDDPDAMRSLGHCLKALGRMEDAGSAYSEAHRLLRTPGTTALEGLPTFTTTTRSKLRHDVEQFAWLLDQGIGEDQFPVFSKNCEALLQTIGPDATDGQLIPLPSSHLAETRSWYNRCLHLHESPRIDEGVLSIQPETVEADYRNRAPGIAWIDDFLTPEALASLRKFCLDSTFWYDCDHPNGYLGAYLQDGFVSPLLLQIADELSGQLPGIFGDHRLMQLWAYKYDSRMSGIDIHADFAAVNVNFWITPTQANDDPESGGMVIWDVEAPMEWTMDEYNTYDPVQQSTIRKFLKDSNANRIVVPHRQNRCVVFNSNLLHRTDDISFRDNYPDRRINITMLFGHREKAS